MVSAEPSSGRPQRQRWLWLLLVGVMALAVGLSMSWLRDRSAAGWRSTAAFVGDQVCASCHADVFATYRRTAHASTSALATSDAVHGNFGTGTAIFRTGNPELHFRLEARAGELRQTAVRRSSPTEELTRTERMDIVVGSGRKGQTFFYWDENRLFQLPVSFWAEHGLWVNSPGFVDGQANFERPIIPRCLECHASAFVSLAPPQNAYDRSSLVLGISCEKCHGPGGEHVARYRSSSPPPDPADGAADGPVRPVSRGTRAGAHAAAVLPAGRRPGGTPDLSAPGAGRACRRAREPGAADGTQPLLPGESDDDVRDVP
jgi:hypothetical protein